MGDTSIEWTANDDGTPGKTWNPVRGCSIVSPGCHHCYAMRIAGRFSGPGKPFDGFVKLTTKGARWTGHVEPVIEHLADPLRWRRPTRVFVNSMSDVFHERLSNEAIAAVFGVMAACRRHTFIVLTKRSTRMREWFAWRMRTAEVVGVGDGQMECVDRCMVASVKEGGDSIRSLLLKATLPERWEWPLPNVILGVSVEDRKHGVPRIDDLRHTPAAVRVLSIEPLLEDLGRIDLTGIGWAIVGAESGPGARPFSDVWARSLRDQCLAAGVPFFVKQLCVDDRLTTDIGRFPTDLQIREFPQ